MIPVIWFGLNPDEPIRGCYFDQGMLEDLLAGELWKPGGWPEFVHYEIRDPVHLDAYDFGGAVVVIRGDHHVGLMPELNAALNALEWMLLIVTGDEQASFPWRDIKHPNARVWLQTPRRSLHEGIDQALPSGFPPGTRAALAEPTEKPLDWAYMGQVTNPMRRGWANALSAVPNGRLLETPGFTQGLPRGEYLETLSNAKLAPAPGGVLTPDTFRIYEALEAGCLPIVGPDPGIGEADDYFGAVLGEHPLPVCTEPTTLPVLMERLLEDWPANAIEAGAWWIGWKRDLAYKLRDDIETLSGQGGARDPITVIVTSSPIPSHPSTAILDQTLASIRERLPDAEIILAFDGVHEKWTYHADAYDEYQRRALRGQQVGVPTPGVVPGDTSDEASSPAGAVRSPRGASEGPPAGRIAHSDLDDATSPGAGTRSHRTELDPSSVARLSAPSASVDGHASTPRDIPGSTAGSVGPEDPDTSSTPVPRGETNTVQRETSRSSTWNLLPIRASEHLHQGNLTKLALAQVRTPLILFVEHDTPLTGDLDFTELARPVADGWLDVLRLYPETVIPDEHRYLMHGEVETLAGVPVQRTFQWSQRPHLARAQWYREHLDRHFGPEARAFIEDVSYGSVEHAMHHGSWEDFRLAIYHPPGNIQRSGHTDGRAQHEKVPQKFSYSGATPPGSPFPFTEA